MVVMFNSSLAEWAKVMTGRNMQQLAIISQMVKTLKIIALDIMMVVSKVSARVIHLV
jgi:hypothetical protein